MMTTWYSLLSSRGGLARLQERPPWSDGVRGAGGALALTGGVGGAAGAPALVGGRTWRGGRVVRPRLVAGFVGSAVNRVAQSGAEFGPPEIPPAERLAVFTVVPTLAVVGHSL